MATKKLKIGIIGTGNIAGQHFTHISKLEDVELTCGADIVPSRAAEFFASRGSGARAYDCYKKMLEQEQLDCVTICTYNTTHADTAIAALEKGIHVLLEKPMSVTLDQAVEMARAEKASGKILMVGFQPRYDRNMKKIKEIVQSGELGKIYYIQTGGGRRRNVPNRTFIEKATAGTGALGDIGCYALDMVMNAIGYPKPITISGYTSDYFGSNPKYNNPKDAARFDVDDFAAGFVRLEGDIVLDFRTSWAMHPTTAGDTIIFGTEGALRIPSTETWNGAASGPMVIHRDIAGSQVNVEIPLFPPMKEHLFYYKLREFVDAVRSGAPSPIPTREAVINQAIIDGITRSAELGREVTVDIPEI